MLSNNKLKKLTISILSLFTSFSIINATVLASDISDQSNYYKWTQTDEDQPWVKAWGGADNQGCFAVSIGVQGARTGFKKMGKGSPNVGKNWDPGNIADEPKGGAAATQYGADAKGKDYTFSSKVNKGNFSASKMNSDSNFQEDAPGMGAAKARKAIKAIYEQGYYPIIHLSKKAGYPADTHYIAVNKVSGNKISYYDPGRTKNSDTAKTLKQQVHKSLLSTVAWVNGYGGGPIKIQDAPSKPASNFNSKDSTKGDKNNSNNDSKSDAPRIKPIFNPFTTPTVNNTSIGADTDTKNSAFDRGSQLTFYQWIGPKFVQIVQIVAIICMMVFIAWVMISGLFMYLDETTGGLIDKVMSHAANKNGLVKAIFYPGNSSGLFGFQSHHGLANLVDIYKRLFIIVFICGLVLTDVLPIILGNIFSFMAHINF